jgi:betaine-aldehyde dehydrogenase
MSAGSALPVIDCYTEAEIVAVPAAGPDEVDHAVHAARKSFPAWRARPAAARCAYLAAAARALELRIGEVAGVISREVGMPIGLSKKIQVGLPVSNLRFYGDCATPIEAKRIDNSLVTAEPYGVVACITPWNYPLHQLVSKVAPALAVGNCVVVKPSEEAPISALILAQVFDEIGLPPGVFNVINGDAASGRLLAAHPQIDMISFTGSTAVGRQIGEQAGRSIIPMGLELGGKSASVVLPGADLGAAVKATAASCLLNSGQTCTALTRVVVANEDYDEAIELLVRAVERFSMGDPFDPNTRMGPLVSDRHRSRVREAIASAETAGARIATGGNDADVPPHGYFVAPTVLVDLDSHDAIAQTEVFGPVLVILRYSSTDDAVRIANDTVYGLSGAVWGSDVDSALEIARQLDAGQIDLNGAAFNPQAPFGGFKQSGIGREGGIHWLHEFSQMKSIQLPRTLRQAATT